ncbi:MAG: HAD-IIB family hydrolase [Betaproteobacteria bacterium]|nr:HAD-IIB family hydrolase [Betaproteobacteria bacterium]
MARPLREIPVAALRAIRGPFLDIDDTLTTDGKLTAEAYDALERAHRVGLLGVSVTGRPAGWCDHIARMWPVDAVVGENGAFYFRHDDRAQKLIKRFVDNNATRRANRARLAMIRDEILAAVPGYAVASDQRYREADLAIDFCEDVPSLPTAAIDQIVALMTTHGMTAKVSSIHVNGWFGSYNKLGMTRTLCAEQFGIDLDRSRHEWLFIGDSPNDAPMFGFFPHSVGVANVMDFLGRIDSPPRYVSHGRSGDGFAELVGRLLAARDV